MRGRLAVDALGRRLHSCEPMAVDRTRLPRTRNTAVDVAEERCPCGREIRDGELVVRRALTQGPWVHAACRVMLIGLDR